MKSIYVRLLAPVVLCGVVLLGTCIVVLLWVRNQNTLDAGLTAAKAMTNEIATLRTFYAAEVVPRAKQAGLKVDFDFVGHQDTMPLPATLVRALGEQIEKDYPGTAIRLYSRFPFPNRASTERYDSFELGALAKLERDPTTPVYSIEEVGGRLSVRYAVADLMRESCVECHNTRADSPKKDWRVGDVRGAVEVTVPVDAVDDAMLTGTLRIALVVLGGVLLMLIALATLGRRLLRPLRHLGTVFTDVGEGNLNAKATVHTNDELGALANNTNTMIGQLREMVGGIRSASLQTSEASAEILGAAQQHEQGGAEQLAGFDELTRTAKGNADAARAIAASSEKVKKAADEMATAAEQARIAVERSRGGMQDILTRNQGAAERIAELYERSQAIIKVVDIIDGISTRLDILALNAGLEGSRAGDAGKGFSLVAQEMRRLAESVLDSTAEIKATLQEIQRLTQTSMDATATSAGASEEGAQEMEKTATMLTDIFGLIERTAQSTREITVSTQQQLSSTEQMVQAITQMNSVSSQSVVASRQVTKAAVELTAMAGRLNDLVGTLRVDETPARATKA